MYIGGLVDATRLASADDPLFALELNGFAPLELCCSALRGAGAREVYVCLPDAPGHEPPGIPATARRASSLNEALAKLGGCDAVLLLGADRPLAGPGVFRSLFALAKGSRDFAVVPAAEDKDVSPVLLSRGYAAALAAGTLERGAFLTARSPAPMSIRGAEDALSAAALARRSTGVSESVCARLFEECETLPKIREHTRKVAVIADAMALALARSGQPLDLALVHSGARLHDVLRLIPGHGEAAAEMLRGKGYLALADAVERHMSVEWTPLEYFDEAAVIYLADKLVRNDGAVTIEQRYEPAALKFAGDPVIMGRVRGGIVKSNAYRRRFEELTGLSLYELCAGLAAELLGPVG